jgi:DNA ligase 1
LYINKKGNFMKNPWDIIVELEQTNSSTQKKELIQQAADASNDIFFSGVKLALDPLSSYGVKQIPVHGGPDGPGLSFDEFAQLAEKLSKRELTGHAARDAIDAALKVATRQEFNNWYRRILLKDLRCGVSETTINKVTKKLHPQYMIDVFACQLAHDGAKHEGKVVGKKQIESKLDGSRVLTIIRTDGRVEMFSRNGKQFHNFGHIADQIAAVIKKSPPAYDLVLDGEVMSASFQDLMKQIHRKIPVESSDAVLNLFDIIPLKNFKSGKWEQIQSVRSCMIQEWVNEHRAEMPNVQVLDYELVDLDTDAGQFQFKLINEAALDGGYEGVMIKDPSAPYECKRSVAWLKRKPVITVDLTIIEVEEGTGKYTGVAGALVCEGEDKGRWIKSNVGSGLTDAQRVDIWENKAAVIGQIGEIAADAVTKPQDSDTYSLRFPRFFRFRSIEAGSKI